MAVWVDCTASSNFYGHWQADLGVYTGPWPMMPTGEETLIPADDWLYFVLALPNPAAPGDVTQAMDGSYDTQLWDAWRKRLSVPPPESTYGFDLAAIGAAPVPDGGSLPPAGYHLYVVANFAAGEPSTAPEAFVPIAYTAAGISTVATLPGGWSDWHPGPVVKHASFHSYATGFHDPILGPALNTFASMAVKSGGAHNDTSAPSPVFPPADPSLPTVIEQVRKSWNDAKAAVPSDVYDLNYVANDVELWDVFNRIDEDLETGSYFEGTWGQYGGRQIRDGWTAPTSVFDTIDTGGLVADVDYIDPPYGFFPTYGDGTFDRDNGLCAAAWLDVGNYLLCERVHTDGIAVDAYTETHADLIRVWAGPAGHLVNQDGAAFSDPTSYIGKEAGWLVPGLSGLTNVADAALQYFVDDATAVGTPGTFDPTPLPLSDTAVIPADTTTVVVAFAPDALVDAADVQGADGLTTPSIPTALNLRAIGIRSGPAITRDPAALYDDTDFALSGLPYMAHNPRWRYWRPDTIGPALFWQTFLDPEVFQIAEGVPLRIYTPGYGWVPWRAVGSSA